jgi:hypothetical protein
MDGTFPDGGSFPYDNVRSIKFVVKTDEVKKN